MMANRQNQQFNSDIDFNRFTFNDKKLILNFLNLIPYKKSS